MSKITKPESSIHSIQPASQLTTGGAALRASKRPESYVERVLTQIGDEDPEEILEEKTRSEKIKAFLVKWHLPMFFVFVLLVGNVFPYPGKQLNEADLGGICLNSDTCVFDSFSDFGVSLIFINAGMRLRTDEIRTAFKEYKAVIYGVISILFITPLVTFWTITWEFSEPEFAIGLSLFFAQTTSLSSGPTICSQSGGNVALALLLTVICNLLGVFTMPIFVTRFLKNQPGDAEVDVDTFPIIVQLIFLILFPMIFGKALRYSEKVVDFTKKHKILMKLSSSTLLASIIWMNISSSQEDLKQTNFGSIALLFVPGFGIHMMNLIFNYSVITFFFRLRQPEKRSLVLMSSAKTLPVALTVLQLLDDETVGSKGLVAIPMIASHFIQVVFDAFLGAYWAGIPIESLNADATAAEGNPTLHAVNPSFQEIGSEDEMRKTL